MLCPEQFIWRYSTDLMQRHTHEWHALESNPLSTKILSIHHRVQVDALVKYAREGNSHSRHLQNRVATRDVTSVM